MQYIGMLFSVLGIGLHIRMLGWLLDPVLRDSFASIFFAAPFLNKMLMVGATVFPFAYYGLSIYSCTGMRRTVASSATVVVVIVVAVLYFGNLHANLPGVAKNSLWAGILTFPYFFLKPKSTKNGLAHLVDETQADTAQELGTSTIDSSNPYTPPRADWT